MERSNNVDSGNNLDYAVRQLSLIKQFWIQLGLTDEQMLANVESNDVLNSKDSLRKIFHHLLLGKHFLIEGALIKAKKNIFAADALVSQLIKTTVLTIRKNDLYAYCLYEMATFYRSLYDYEHYERYMDLAQLFAESESVVNLMESTIEGNRFHRFYEEVSSGDLPKYSLILEYFRKNKINYALVVGLFRRFAILVDQEDYYKAYDDYFDGTALAESIGLSNYVAAFQTGLGFMMQKQHLYTDALQNYRKAYDLSESWYRKSSCLENISTVYEHYQDYEKSLEYQKKSLEICEKYGVLCNIPADCYYIGRSYENNFRDLKKALFYYKKGHDLAQILKDDGVYLHAFNQKIITQYTDFITKYYVEEADKDNYEQYLTYALSSNWREIKDNFHYCLIMHHKTRFASGNEMREKLGLKTSTLQAIQRRLNDSGFSIPDFRFGYARNIETEIDPGLRAYIQLIEDLDWKAANDRFETDVINMLMKHFNNNKSALCENLGVSYATVISLTKNLGTHSSVREGREKGIEDEKVS